MKLWPVFVVLWVCVAVCLLADWLLPARESDAGLGNKGVLR